MDQQDLWNSTEAPIANSPSSPAEMTRDQLIAQALERRELRALDLQFAAFIARQGGSEALQLAALLVSEALGQGHSCLPLDQPLAHYGEPLCTLFEQIQQQPLQTDAVLLGDGSSVTPLVQVGQRLYLYRYWLYEQQVAQKLLTRHRDSAVDSQWLTGALDRLFGAVNEQTDWQRVAAAVALNNPLSVISGGPGTGKTTTVVKMLALWLENRIQQQPNQTPLIRLAAPTGKAAARLAESIAGARDRLDISDQVKALIPDAASTLHRLLGSLPGTKRFRHNADNPLHLDLLVVDEASMVDLPMMARLLDALSEKAQLLLIGDRDQLASVEAGAVLGDICAEGLPAYSPAQQQLLASSCGLAEQAEGAKSGAIADSLALLRHSYRFDQHSGIGHLARAVNNGDSYQAHRLFAQGYQDIAFHALDTASYAQLIGQAVDGYRTYLQSIVDAKAPAEVLSAFADCQLLCAVREGPYGVDGLNEEIEKALTRQRLIRADSSWYSGRPVMISRNEPALGLFNGDIGIAMPDEQGKLRVWFEQQGEVRAVLPSRLPEHQTVYAMTIHKSQGSEFTKVLMVLPDQDSPLLTRELVYTGITRAKEECELYCRWTVFRQATERRTRRSGGLAPLLWRSAAD